MMTTAATPMTTPRAVKAERIGCDLMAPSEKPSSSRQFIMTGLRRRSRRRT